MSLPDLIEIVPLQKPVKAEVTVPGSKSITNRALVLAALAHGPVTLKGALWSEDTQVMVECLHKLGFRVDVHPDPNESCNRFIYVEGRGGRIPNAGTVEEPLELFVGNAGTAARFLAAMVCLGKGVYRLSGISRMHERPQAALFQALRQLGYRVDSPNDKLPAIIHGEGWKIAKCQVSVQESSQFASALILSAEVGKWQIEVTGANEDELPYVDMTRELVRKFHFLYASDNQLQIEPDASSGSYFWAAGSEVVRGETKQTIEVRNWPVSSWQIDQNFSNVVFALVQGLKASYPDVRQELVLSELDLPPLSRNIHLGDSIMTAIVMAPFLHRGMQFTDLGRLRVQECERVVALRTELTKCGAKVIEEGDTLTVYPSQLHGAEIETYNDHRMAMCFAVVGLRVPGIKLRNPSCVKKTFPNFFQKLAKDLGVTILDAQGKKLGHEDLFAA